MQEIKSLSQFNKLKANPLLIIDFYATWCGPCKAISPRFEGLSNQYDPSIFAKCDVDKAKDVAQTCGITAMPTFQFFKNGNKVDEVRGADVQQLTTKIGYYTAALAKEAPTQKAAPSNAGPTSLRPLLDVQASKILGTSTLSSIRNIASPPPAGYAVASATGQSQLLLHLVFKQPVTPSTIKIKVPSDSKTSAPSRIQIGTNVPVVTRNVEGVESNDLQMESITKAENTQSFNIYSDEYNNDTTQLKLKASKFSAIRSMTIRIDANLGGEPKTVTKIGEMDIVGIRV